MMRCYTLRGQEMAKLYLLCNKGCSILGLYYYSSGNLLYNVYLIKKELL